MTIRLRPRRPRLAGHGSPIWAEARKLGLGTRGEFELDLGRRVADLWLGWGPACCGTVASAETASTLVLPSVAGDVVALDRSHRPPFGVRSRHDEH